MQKQNIPRGRTLQGHLGKRDSEVYGEIKEQWQKVEREREREKENLIQFNTTCPNPVVKY